MTLTALRDMGRATLAVTIFAILSFLPSPASANYRLGAGDVLQIAVFGLSDFGRKVTINIDGEVSVPFLGEVQAAGMSLSEFRTMLARKLEENGAVRDAQLTVEIVEHRPFYIGGDVAKPGAHPYRPGLTVRHAIFLAGGLDVMRYRSGNPLLLAPEIQSEHAAAWLELVKAQARLIGLRAELNGSETADFSILSNAPIGKSLIASVIDLEERNLKQRLEAHRKEISFLERAVAKAEEQVGSLEVDVDQQAAVVKQQEEAIARVAGNAARGITAQTRVDEETRALAMLKAQHSDAQGRLALARKEVRDGQRSLERALEERRIRLTEAVQDTLIEVDKYRAKVSGSGEKLMVTGQLKARLRDGVNGPNIVLYRRTADGIAEIPATADTDIQPDDVLEVTVKADLLAAY